MLDPAIEDAIRRRFEGASFARWIGMELASLSDGACEVRLSLQPHHLNPGGTAHGGIVASLLDVAIGLALRTRLSTEETHFTLQLHIQYLRAASRGLIIARGRTLHSGARATFGEGDLVDERDRLLARATATFLNVPVPAG